MSEGRYKAHWASPEYGTVEVYCDAKTGEIIGLVEDIDKQEASENKPEKKPPPKDSKKEA